MLAADDLAVRGPELTDSFGRWAALRALPGTLRRGLGAALLLLGCLPLYRLLDPTATGPLGAMTRVASDATFAYSCMAGALVLASGLLLGRFLPLEPLERFAARARTALTEAPVTAWAVGLALVTALLALSFSRLVLLGRPTITDAMAQLLHARYLAEGRWSVPMDGLTPFRQVQNGVFTPHGWVSQYPPGYPLLLAAGLRVGAVELVGPALAGIAAFFGTLAAERLLAPARALARAGSLLAAVSPFALGLAGAYMNHVAVAAAIAAALYCALRARDGGAAWAVPAGAAIGFACTVRPLSALALGAVATLGTWSLTSSRAGGRPLILRLLLAAVAALPFLLGLAAYNRYFFGAPFRFGYDAAWGANAGLGFHVDPWGNRYGAREALAYTSSDLVALGLNLLETPLSAVLLVGTFLLLAPRLRLGERLLVAGALLPVGANALYWYHGLVMGPRLLSEASTFWVLLTVCSAAGLLRLLPRQVWLAGAAYSPRVGLASAFLLALLLAAVLGPDRLRGQAGGYHSVLTTPAPPVQEPALVFVHDAWSARLAARLAGRGFSLDRVEAGLRQNDACDLQRFLTGAMRPGAGAPDLQPRPTTALSMVEITPGDAFRSAGPSHLSGACLREIAADRLGVVDITPLLWRTDLPGVRGKGALVVRDLGPEENGALIRRLPDRQPLAYLRPTPEAAPVLLPYVQAMRLLWAAEKPPAGTAPARAKREPAP